MRFGRLFLALLLCLACVALFGGAASAQSKSAKKPAVGAARKIAKSDPQVIDAAGLQRLLETYRGKPVMVSFWATWCDPCRDEYPMVGELEGAFRAKGLVVLAVSLDDDSELPQVREFLSQHKPAFRNFRKKAGQDEAFINSVDPAWSGALPATFFYDREGRLAAKLFGEHKRPEFEKIIAQLLPAALPDARKTAAAPRP